MYLDELRDTLDAVCDNYLSPSTIWRALERRGYRMKKVHLFTWYLDPTNVSY